jgi:hypothetical protein
MAKFSISAMFGHTFGEFLLGHLVSLVCMEVLVHHSNGELQDRDEKKELSKTDEAITVSVRQVKNLVHSRLEFLDVFLVTFNLTIVVWCQRSEKVTVGHD